MWAMSSGLVFSLLNALMRGLTRIADVMILNFLFIATSRRS